MTTFATATTIDDAVAAVAGGARPVAGGTDLVVGARQGKEPLPEALVAIHRVEALRGIEPTGQGLRLGALVTHAEIAADPAMTCGLRTALSAVNACCAITAGIIPRQNR